MATLHFPSLQLCLTLSLVCSIFFSCLILARAEDVTSETSDQASTVDIYALSRQWEDYGRSVAASLVEEQSKTAAYVAEIEKLRTSIVSAETSLGEKETLLQSLESDLSGFASAGEDLKGQLRKALAMAALSETLEAGLKEAKRRLKAAEKKADEAMAERQSAQVVLRYSQAAGLASLLLLLGLAIGWSLSSGPRASSEQSKISTSKRD